MTSILQAAGHSCGRPLDLQNRWNAFSSADRKYAEQVLASGIPMWATEPLVADARPRSGQGEEKAMDTDLCLDEEAGPQATAERWHLRTGELTRIRSMGE